jgi:hypothetical protein
VCVRVLKLFSEESSGRLLLLGDYYSLGYETCAAEKIIVRYTRSRQEVITCDYCEAVKSTTVDERVTNQIFKNNIRALDICYRCYDKSPSYFKRSNSLEPKILKIIKDNPAITFKDILSAAECNAETAWETLIRLGIKRVQQLWKQPTPTK